ncbi:hypothetical protein [Nesterenkonia sp. NBAIMH1]|uniref:hypothetical protein n=1 Tax=Nesterenkonia sp. NBAIMH1 TaxID=2600320 RepID=UPI0011B5D34D|nr:hypothetical protein [Nesterenkonia sp. NBAIMH1]
MTPQHPDEYPDPEIYPEPDPALQQRHAPWFSSLGDYPDPEGDYPDTQVLPPQQRAASAPGPLVWNAHLQSVRDRTGQLSQKLSQKVSERGPEWAEQARKYGDDFTQRSAQQALEVSASTKERLGSAHEFTRREVLGRPMAVVIAQAMLAVAALAAFVGTMNFAGRFLATPRRWMSWIQSQETSFVGAMDEGIEQNAQRIQEGAVAAADGLALVPLLVATPILTLYALAIFGMWYRRPRARTLSFVLAVAGAVVTFVFLSTPLRFLVAFNARGFLVLAAVLGIMGMIIMLLPAVNDWVAHKRGSGAHRRV